jgi:glucosamine--fructose-6-phosphate aminotransferase (isomerizing)
MINEMEPNENNYYTYHEIPSQPGVSQSTLTDLQASTDNLLRLWNFNTLQEVLFTGCGSTYYLAQAAAAIFQAATGLPGRAYPASEILFFPNLTLPPGKSRLLVAISRSGETTETVRAVERFRSRRTGAVIAITCNASSALAERADAVFAVRGATETSLAQTRSFSAMFVAAAGLAAKLSGQSLSDAYLKLPEVAAALLHDHQTLARALGTDPSIQRFFFLGNGPLYGLANEAMLKMKEMSLSYSEAYHFLEFRHGPMSMVDRSALVVGLLSETAFSYEAAVLADMRRLGARVLAFTPAPLSPEQADHTILLPAGLSDLERGPLYLPILQLLAFFRALRNGLNPDQPENLRMVIELEIEPIPY